MSCGLFIHNTIISHTDRTKRTTLKNFTLTLYHIPPGQKGQKRLFSKILKKVLTNSDICRILMLTTANAV